MKEIRFRVMRKDGELDYFDLKNAHKYGLFSPTMAKNYTDNFEQFIGLHDKNGKDIYEGDIVKDVEWGLVELVKYKKSCAGYYPFSAPAFDGYEWENIHVEDCEIIGNKHENQELLEEIND